jgi:YesN/AraC family two-component response regulator
MRLYIKNMVCVRCKMVVKSELENLGFHHILIKDGEVEIGENVSSDKLDKLKLAVNKLGLELIDDRESILVEKIKNAISELVYNSEDGLKTTFSEYISSILGYSYHYLSNLFSAVHGNSIEKYFIHCKIDRVKEILIHEEISFSEIAFKMHYSSVAHLSSQFRKETGLTLSQFRRVNPKRNK